MFIMTGEPASTTGADWVSYPKHLDHVSARSQALTGDSAHKPFCLVVKQEAAWSGTTSHSRVRTPVRA